jgi:hypothetical protein
MSKTNCSTYLFKMDSKTFLHFFFFIWCFGMVTAKGDEDGLTIQTSFSNWRNLDRQQQQQQRTSLSNSTTYLSRKRRFIYPAVAPWLFDFRVTIVIPLQGLDTTLNAYIPFTWNLNTLT